MKPIQVVVGRIPFPVGCWNSPAGGLEASLGSVPCGLLHGAAPIMALGAGQQESERGHLRQNRSHSVSQPDIRSDSSSFLPYFAH